MFWILSKTITIDDLLKSTSLSELRKKIELNKKQKEKLEAEPTAEVTISMTPHALNSTNFNVIQTSLPGENNYIEGATQYEHESEY